MEAATISLFFGASQYFCMCATVCVCDMWVCVMAGGG